MKTAVTDFSSAGKAYSIVGEANREAGEYIFRIHVQKEPPLVDWSLIIGDCLHNARTSLDHLFQGLMKKQNPGGVTGNISQANFPIFKDSATFNGRRLKIERWVGALALAILEDLQPFNDPRGWNKNGLMFLHDFDIIDKHRLLLPAISIQDSAEFGADTVDNRTVRVDGAIRLLKFQDNAEIARFHVTPAEDVIDMHLSATFDIIFEGQPGPMRVIPNLERVIEVVEETSAKLKPLL